MAQNPPPIIQNLLNLVTQRITFTGSTHIAEVTFAYFPDITNPTPQTMINAFQTAFNAQILPNMDTDCLAQPPTAIVGNGGTAPGVVTAAGAAAAGGNAITSLPPQVCALIKKTTAQAGKQGRGRMYLPYALAQANVDQLGAITGGTTRTDLTESFTDLLEDLATAHIVPVIAHRVLGPAVEGKKSRPVTAINGGPTITAMACEATVGTQRRRLVRQ